MLVFEKTFSKHLIFYSSLISLDMKYIQFIPRVQKLNFNTRMIDKNEKRGTSNELSALFAFYLFCLFHFCEGNKRLFFLASHSVTLFVQIIRKIVSPKNISTFFSAFWWASFEDLQIDSYIRCTVCRHKMRHTAKNNTKSKEKNCLHFQPLPVFRLLMIADEFNVRGEEGWRCNGRLHKSS